MWTLYVLQVGKNQYAVYDTDKNWNLFFSKVKSRRVSSYPIAYGRYSDYQGPACQLSRIHVLEDVLGCQFVSEPMGRDITSDSARLNRPYFGSLTAL